MSKFAQLLASRIDHRQCWLLPLVCQCSWVADAYASETQAAAYAVKAAFIYNIAKFTDWPPPSAENMTLCVIGEETMITTLSSLQEKAIHNHPVRILQVSSQQSVSDCQVLFISGDNARRSADILKRVMGRPLLTIGEAEGFAESGGMIGLIERDNHVVFQINISALTTAKLKVSSQLLRLAHTTLGNAW